MAARIQTLEDREAIRALLVDYGFSRGTWVSTNAENRLQVSIIANYYDQFVKENGRWKFKRHQIGGPPPSAASRR
jgi:hypothetical protein